MGCRVKLSSASYCASSARSLASSQKNPVPIMNLRGEWIKAPVISDNSHCRFTALLCSHQKSSLKHLVPTVGYLGLLTLANWADQPAVPETADNWGNKANSKPPPSLPPTTTTSTTHFLSPSTTITHIQQHFPHMCAARNNNSLLAELNSLCIKERSVVISATQQCQLPQCHRNLHTR